MAPQRKRVDRTLHQDREVNTLLPLTRSAAWRWQGQVPGCGQSLFSSLHELGLNEAQNLAVCQRGSFCQGDSNLGPQPKLSLRRRSAQH